MTNEQDSTSFRKIVIRVWNQPAVGGGGRSIPFDTSTDSVLPHLLHLVELHHRLATEL